jgi:hypothetical protein
MDVICEALRQIDRSPLAGSPDDVVDAEINRAGLDLFLVERMLRSARCDLQVLQTLSDLRVN